MKLTFLASLSALVFTLGACSTISERQSYSYPLPPSNSADAWGRDPVQVDEQLERQYRQDPKNQPLKLLVRYQQARLWQTRDRAKSCALWSDVLLEPRFPLAQIAKIHAMEACPPEQTQSIEDALSQSTQNWLQELLVRSSLKRAELAKEKAWEMRLSLRVVDFETLQKEKIKRLERAKELALELKDAETEKAAQAKLEGLAPRFIANPPTELLLKVANDFKQAREFEKARSVYRKALGAGEGLSDFDKLKALDGIRISFKLEKKTDEYLKASQESSDFAKTYFLKAGLKKRNPSLVAKYFETRMTLARAIWTEGRPAEAEKLILEAERDVKGTISVADGLFTRARIEEEAGHFERAVALLNDIEIDRINSHDLRMKVLWYRAWNQRKIGRLRQSADALANLIVQEDSSLLSARDRFWYAKTLKELGNSQEAETQFAKLIDQDATGWYSLLAYREMNSAIPALTGDPVRAPARARSLSAFMPEEKLMFEWLLAAGETDLAKNYLTQIAKDRSYDRDQELELLQSYARVGAFQSLFSRLYARPADERKDLLATHPELLFPQPWPALVKTASSKFDVQTELIYSIMRQESSFNPMARSAADAFGLMQLIPEMAKKAEQTAGLKIDSHEDLYTPEANIPLGAAFVHDLQRKWHGAFIPTVASYNASEKAIAGWVATRFRGDPLTFIEDIPYEETRNYIKLVMRNFIFYKRLNSGGAAIPFPEWCLANLQDAKL